MLKQGVRCFLLCFFNLKHISYHQSNRLFFLIPALLSLSAFPPQLFQELISLFIQSK